MANFNLQDYEPVEERLQRYVKKYPDARILTKVVYQDNDRILVKAYLYQNAEEIVAKVPHATGHAEETRGEGYVNKTSHVENCETSAIGRALANAGYSGNKNGQRASREEMEKVQRLSKPVEAGKTIKLDNGFKCPECFAVGKIHAPNCKYGKLAKTADSLRDKAEEVFMTDEEAEKIENFKP